MAVLCPRCLMPARPASECICDDPDPEDTAGPEDGAGDDAA
ncbi:MAG TPA: hypothetical protein VKV80_20080 [Streptosporangiaceae bacterium]|jgi:hypothetical protein|nr:hypothetical protein [Streptosporangiaceae bacterium]